jgi:hypothetical protein
MVASYKNKYSDVAPIIDSLKVQRKIYKNAHTRSDKSPIIDSADVQRNPQRMLQVLCNALDIPFTDKMLSWPAGRRNSDGVWASHWYDAVETSTGFRPYQEKTTSLSPELEAIAEKCHEDYAFFHRLRLRA